MTALAVAIPELAAIEPDGTLSFAQFHQGQREAYWSEARFTLVLAGTQGGKTAVGPPWLLKQMQQRGPGDYMVVSPTYTLMEKKALPEFLRLFEDALHLGQHNKNTRTFTITREGARSLWGVDVIAPSHVFFGYGENPNSLESATLKAVWVDEGGQKEFKRESWQAILRRLSIEEGPVLLTSTPYLLGWLSELVESEAANVRVINFPSIANPRFRKSEWDRAKAELPPWKFNMFYRGLFERPAGMIYDCWSDDDNLVGAFAIPDAWPRHLGLDFGGVNTAGIYLAQELAADGTKTGRFYAYREYHAGGRTAAQHAVALAQREPRQPKVTGGSKSEDQWRWEFARAGLPVGEPPIAEVEVGINRVYGLIASRNLLVFDSLRGLRDQILSYSRELDDAGEPTEKIEDKETFHYLDALRYGVAGATGSRGATMRAV
jgi:hypothetical protein